MFSASAQALRTKPAPAGFWPYGRRSSVLTPGVGLQCLMLRDSACCVVMEWLNSSVVAALDWQFAGIVRRLASQLPGALAAVLTQEAVDATELIEVL